MIDDQLLHDLAGSRAPDGRVLGLVIGVVTSNEDPDGLHRVKLRFPWLSPDDDSNWARVATPMAGPDRGVYFLPEVDDEVLVGFEHGRVDAPYVLGALWNGKDAPPESNGDGANNIRTIRSRSGHVLRFDDTEGAERIEIIDKSDKNRVIIDTANNAITVEADADITISSATGTLSLKARTVEIEAQAGIKARAGQNLELEASGQVSVQGALIKLN